MEAERIQRVRRQRPSLAVPWSLAASCAAHGALLAGLTLGASGAARAPASSPADALKPSDAEPFERTYVDLLAADVMEAEPPVAKEATRPGAVAADVTSVAEPLTAPRRGTPALGEAPAADSGDDAGRALPVAFRRDRSTLHERVYDGANVYQPSRQRTGRRASSPQAVRQEPKVGIGDSARTAPATAAVPLPSAVPPSPPSVADGERVVPAAGDRAAAGAPVAPVGQGPLAADHGERRYDVPTLGRARDTQAMRAASNEPRPGLLDLYAPAALGTGQAGHGPALRPGAADLSSAGAAPAIHGTPAAEQGTDLVANTVERRYWRYVSELGQRVRRVVSFPRRLALELHQGETIVRFVVRPDGRIAGKVQVIKSAGFDEFDAEAVAAVERAAPFPPPEQELSVNLRVPFQNPLIR